MPTAQFSSKGQIVIPKAIRDRHAFAEGQRVEVIDTPDGVLLKKPRASTETFDEITARIQARARKFYSGPPVPIEEMNAAIDEMFRTDPRYR